MAMALRTHVLMVAIGALSLGQCAGAQRCSIVSLDLRVPADPGDRVGTSLAIAHGRLAIGARRGGPSNGGAVYLFDLGALTAPIELVHPTGQAPDRFGDAVALDATRVIVGAPRDAAPFIGNGSALVFNASDGAFVMMLNAPTPGLDELFGSSVAITGGSILVGAPYDIDYGLQGSAYLFDSQGRLQRQLHSDIQDWDGFGTAVAMDDRYAIVGAPFVDIDGHSAGAAYVFDATSGAYLRRLSLSVPHSGSQLGTSLAFDGTRLVVGAPFDAPRGVETGAAHVFDVATGDWLAALAPPNGIAYAQFGQSVAMADGWIAVGAPDAGAGTAGAVYLFDDTTFELLAMIDVPRMTRFGAFGWSVALGGDRLAAGAPFTDTGAAFLYAIQCDRPCPADLTGDAIVDAADLALLLGAWGSCGKCLADLVNDGVVDAGDLAIVLGAWGPCGTG
ncbi:MAG: hypothetical protein U0572_01590 [Phycisphaerales bacterium]